MPPESGRGHLHKEVVINEAFLINRNIFYELNFKSYQLRIGPPDTISEAHIFPMYLLIIKNKLFFNVNLSLVPTQMLT